MRLVEDWASKWWRMWSNQFAVVVGMLMSVLVEQQAVILPVISKIESPVLRMIVTLAITAIPPIALRMLHQPSLKKEPGNGNPA